MKKIQQFMNNKLEENLNKQQVTVVRNGSAPGGGKKALSEIAESFASKYKKYVRASAVLYARKRELERKIERVDAELKSQKQPCWVEELVVPIAEEMVKRMRGMEYDYWGPHGIDNILTVFFFPKGVKTAEEIITGKESQAISFVTGDLTKSRLLVKDFTKELGVFKKGSMPDLNGMNYPNVLAKMDVGWFLKWLKKQNRRSHNMNGFQYQHNVMVGGG